MKKMVIVFLLLDVIRSTDIRLVPELRRVQSLGGEVLLACSPSSSHVEVYKLEWKCRECFSLSPFKDYTLATKEGIQKDSRLLDRRFQIVRVGNSYSLNIKGSRVEDSGKYFCLINNSTAPAVVFSLAIQDVTSSPGRPLIMSFDSRSVSLSWTPPVTLNFAPVSQYTIQILEGEDESWTEYQTINTQNAELSFRASNLNPFTVYSFRVAAINRMGISEPSEPSYFMMTARELPTGKVKILEAYSLTAESIFLSWAPPQQATINGEFLGYRVSWRLRDDRENSELNRTDVKDPHLTKVSVGALLSFSSYLFSIQVLNPLGAGPGSSVLVTTQSSAPHSPLNVTVTSISDTVVSLSWQQPFKQSNHIRGYRVYYSRNGHTEADIVTNTGDTLSHNLTTLVPFTQYEVSVGAFADSAEGKPSRPIKVLTDVSGPGVPEISNLSCPSDTSIYLQWSKPQDFYHSVDKYRIFYKQRESGERWTIREVEVPVVQHSHEVLEKVLLTNLTKDSEYTIFIQGLTHSLYEEDRYFTGDSTEIINTTPGQDCNKIQVSPMREEESGSSVLMACFLGTVFVFIIIVLISLLLVCRKRFSYRELLVGVQRVRRVEDGVHNRVQFMRTVQSQELPLWNRESFYPSVGVQSDLCSRQTLWDGQCNSSPAVDPACRLHNLCQLHEETSQDLCEYCVDDPERFEGGPIYFREVQAQAGVDRHSCCVYPYNSPGPTSRHPFTAVSFRAELQGKPRPIDRMELQGQHLQIDEAGLQETALLGSHKELAGLVPSDLSPESPAWSPEDLIIYRDMLCTLETDI